jgi:hypothetical protein
VLAGQPPPASAAAPYQARGAALMVNIWLIAID